MTASLRVVAVGDLQLGDSPTTVGYGFYSRYARRPLDPLFDATRAALAGADIVFGNLETMLEPPAAGESRRSELQLRGARSFAALAHETLEAHPRLLAYLSRVDRATSLAS